MTSSQLVPDQALSGDRAYRVLFLIFVGALCYVAALNKVDRVSGISYKTHFVRYQYKLYAVQPAGD